MQTAIIRLRFPLAMFCDDAGLQYLTGLQRLTINTIYYGQSFSTHHVELLASILDKIPSSTIKQLMFEIPTPPTSPLVKQWHRIGEVLQQRRFLQLAEVIFEVEGNPREETYGLVENLIREDLYMLEERGILSVRRALECDRETGLSSPSHSLYLLD